MENEYDLWIFVTFSIAHKIIVAQRKCYSNDKRKLPGLSLSYWTFKLKHDFQKPGLFALPTRWTKVTGIIDMFSAVAAYCVDCC